MADVDDSTAEALRKAVTRASAALDAVRPLAEHLSVCEEVDRAISACDAALAADRKASQQH